MILFSSAGVGKSCLLLRFCDDAWTPSFITTIGIDFKIRTIELDGKRIKLQIVRGRPVVRGKDHSNIQGCIVGYCRTGTLQNHHNGLLQRRHGYSADLRRNGRKVFQQCVACGASFGRPSNVGLLDIRTWHSNIEQHASEGVNKILIGNKSDWLDKRQISQEQGQALADEFGIRFMETSAKVNEGVEDAFFTLARQIVLTPNLPGQN